MGRLLIIRGAELGIEYVLEAITEIGRSSDCTIQLLDQSVSKKHARVFEKEKQFFIEDLSSTTGTFLNKIRISSVTKLSDNDEISIGGYSFIYNPDLTLIRAQFSDQYLIISPHKPEEINVETQIKETILSESSLKVLSKILEYCLLSADVKHCLDEILKTLVEFFSAERGFVVFFKEEHHDLVSTFGASDRLVISRTIVENIKNNGQIIICRDTCNDVQFQNGISVIEGKLRTIICVPILSAKKILGFFQIDSSQPIAKIPTDTNILLDKVSKCVGSYISKNIKQPKDIEEAEYNFIFASKTMKNLLENIDKASQSSSTCLICGETGTGKEIVAKLIHQKSNRRNSPFIAVNCSAIPETMLESELFGFEKGSFTGAYKTTIGKIELADGGTLFLDEIGDMSLYAQVKLLRFLQERVFYRIGAKRYTRVDVRIIAATNKNLLNEIEAGRFRLDLYYRLAVIPLSVPPLRERKEDIPILAEFFLEQFCKELKKTPIKLSKELMKMLLSYNWHGNVRELKNIMERIAVLGYEPETRIVDFELTNDFIDDPDETESKQEEKKSIIESLRRNRGNKSKTALELDISRPTLDKKLKKYQINIYD